MKKDKSIGEKISHIINTAFKPDDNTQSNSITNIKYPDPPPPPPPPKPVQKTVR